MYYNKNYKYNLFCFFFNYNFSIFKILKFNYNSFYNNATKNKFWSMCNWKLSICTSKFCKFTKLAAKKAWNNGTLSILEYSYLIPNQHQLYDHYYLLIIEPNRNNSNYSKINETF